MSWFGTLADPLQPDICGGGGVKNSSGESSEATANFSDVWEIEDDEPIEQESPKRRVKEDISELKNVLSSKFWGVASFLTPPSSSQTPTSSSSPRIYSSPRMQQEPTISGDSELVDSFESSGKAGIRSDFAEIGGTLKTGIARLSNNVAINGISKIAYNLLSLREDVKEDEEGDEVVVNEEFEDEPFTDVIGVTDEVLAFAGNIACHPETWLDFPLLSDDEDFLNDFDMSEAQQDHALVIESLVPRLAALRIELCPTHMSIWCFWKIYFALLHPRLNKHDADLLSTPQIVEARALLQHGLQNQAKQESEDSRGHAAFKDVDYDPLISSDQFSTPGMLTKYWLSQGSLTSKSIKNLEMEKQSGLTSEAEFVDKFVVKEEPLQMKVKEVFLGNSGEDDDEWPVDETLDGNSAGMATILVCNEEDISFSDLEDSDRWSNFSKSSKSAAH